MQSETTLKARIIRHFLDQSDLRTLYPTEVIRSNSLELEVGLNEHARCICVNGYDHSFIISDDHPEYLALRADLYYARYGVRDWDEHEAVRAIAELLGLEFNA